MIYRVGDKVSLKKIHPCGGSVFTVLRTGADVKIQCDTCGRIVLLDLDTFLRRVKTLVK